MAADDLSLYIIPNDTPISKLDCTEAFNGLTDKEKLYAHHFGRASWEGALICLLQCSPESPGIFLLLQRVFGEETLSSLRQSALTCGLTDDEFNSFLVYAAAFFSNLGNYKSFGDTKFIPNLSSGSLYKLITCSRGYANHRDKMEELWSLVSDRMFSLDNSRRQLGFPPEGLTTYYSCNCNKEDAQLINEFMLEKISLTINNRRLSHCIINSISPYNTRLFKENETTYELRIVSSLRDGSNPSPNDPISCLLGSHQYKDSSKNGWSCWSLLAQVWRSEEKSLEVPRDMMGTLAGTTLPLLSASRNAPGIPPLPTKHISPSIEDVIENMRAKIYALCSRIGFKSLNDKETTEDKITLYIIENYLDFKTGEVWYEIGSELSQEGLRATSPDQECLQEIIQCSEEKAEEVTRQQHELMDEQHRQELDDEYQLYEQLRDAQISVEREQERQKGLLLRTSNYHHLKEAKQKQLQTSEASRPSMISLGERFHSTNHSSLNVTAFCGRQVTIETTPMKVLVNNYPARLHQTTSIKQ